MESEDQKFTVNRKITSPLSVWKVEGLFVILVAIGLVGALFLLLVLNLLVSAIPALIIPSLLFISYTLGCVYCSSKYGSRGFYCALGSLSQARRVHVSTARFKLRKNENILH